MLLTIPKEKIRFSQCFLKPLHNVVEMGGKKEYPLTIIKIPNSDEYLTIDNYYLYFLMIHHKKNEIMCIIPENNYVPNHYCSDKLNIYWQDINNSNIVHKLSLIATQIETIFIFQCMKQNSQFPIYGSSSFEMIQKKKDPLEISKLLSNTMAKLSPDKRFGTEMLIEQYKKSFVNDIRIFIKPTHLNYLHYREDIYDFILKSNHLFKIEKYEMIENVQIERRPFEEKSNRQKEDFIDEWDSLFFEAQKIQDEISNSRTN